MTAFNTLGDCVGSYRLKAECDACGHGKVFDLDELIAANGEDYLIDKLRRRVKCQECGAKAPEVRVQFMSDGRPRG